MPKSITRCKNIALISVFFKDIVPSTFFTVQKKCLLYTSNWISKYACDDKFIHKFFLTFDNIHIRTRRDYVYFLTKVQHPTIVFTKT